MASTKATELAQLSRNLTYNEITDAVSLPTGDILTTGNNTDDLQEGLGNLYYTDARARLALNAGTGVTYNSSTGTISIGQPVATTDDVTFNSVSFGTDATMSWNAVDGTVDIAYGSATLQVGQEQHYYGKATEAILNGEVVMFAGVQGDHILFAKADMNAPGFIPEWIIGVATVDMAINDFGYVTSFGKVRGINTTAYTAGSLLYLDEVTAGALTETEPTTAAHSILIAAVTNSTVNGTIIVRPSHSSELDEAHKVEITNKATGDLLRWNGTNWANQADSFYLDYNNFTNVPTNVSSFSNDSNYATESYVSNAVSTAVTKSNIDALNINADTLDGLDSTYFLNFNNLSNVPSIPSNIFAYISDGVNQYQASGISDTLTFVNGTNTTAVVDGTARTVKFNINTTNLDADQLDGQEGTYYLDYSNFTNTPSIPSSINDLSDVDVITVPPTIGQVLKWDGIRFVPSNDSLGSTGGSGLNYSQSYVTEDNYTGNGTTTDFAVSQLPTSEAHVIVIVNGIVQSSSNYNVSGTTVSFITPPPNGSTVDIRTIKATTTTVELMDGHIFTYTTTGPTTAVAGADDRGDTLVYQPERLQVFVNGIMLVPEVDYGAINGTTISFNDTIPTGSTVQIVTNSLAQIPTQAPIAGDEVIVSTDTQTTVATFDASIYRTAKIVAQVTHSSGGYYSVESMVVHDDISVFMNTFGAVYSIGILGTFDARINNGNVELQFTPNTGLTNCIVRTKLIAVEV